MSDLVERLRNPEWVKNWFDQAGFQAADCIEELEAKLAECETRLLEVTAENRELAMQIISSDGQAIDAYAEKQAAEAMLPRAYRAGVEAGAAYHDKKAAYWSDLCNDDMRVEHESRAKEIRALPTRALPTPTIEQLKEMLKENEG